MDGYYVYQSRKYSATITLLDPELLNRAVQDPQNSVLGFRVSGLEFKFRVLVLKRHIRLS